MSPALRNLLDDAADDGGRPLFLDLAEVRTAGRRAVWRRRAITGGAGLGAAAVIASVALALSPSGINPFGPAGQGGSGLGDSAADELAPLEEALAAKGYRLEDATGGGGMAAAGPLEEGGTTGTLTASFFTMTRDGDVGAVAVAEFTDVSMLTTSYLPSTPPGVIVDYLTVPVCAVPPLFDPADFWTACELHSDGASDGPDYWFASGGLSVADAIGVTLVRLDGSGISVALSEAAYESEGVDTLEFWLEALPLTHVELLEVVTELDRNAPLLDDNGWVGEEIDPGPPTVCASADSEDAGWPCDGEATDSPCAQPTEEAVPNDGYPCPGPPPSPPPSWMDPTPPPPPGEIDATPLVDAMFALGVTVEDLGMTGGTGDDGGTASSVRFRLYDGKNPVGTAAIGLASSVAAAPAMGYDLEPWCAVAPTDEMRVGWHLADDPAVSCTGLDGAGPLVVVRTAPAADAIGATLVRTDGSVISVSITHAVMLEPGEGAVYPANPVPLDREVILDLLAELDAANPI